ncbi:MAG: hypothetical protein ACE5LU_01520 [Anaerolineae bacterium]
MRRWERQYRQGGFEALKPNPAPTMAHSRVISRATLDRAEALNATGVSPPRYPPRHQNRHRFVPGQPLPGTGLPGGPDHRTTL